MNTRDTADKLARLLDYVDYPNDSIEQGDTWHTMPDKAPHGPTISKSEFERRMTDGDFILMLIGKYVIEFNWLTTTTLEVHSRVTGNIITTANGYRMGVLGCLTHE